MGQFVDRGRGQSLKNNNVNKSNNNKDKSSNLFDLEERVNEEDG
jgi:hypothetical protein